MNLPGAAGIENFIMTETNHADAIPIVWTGGTSQAPIDMNTAELRVFGDEDFSYSTAFLKGCTVLAIVSRRGVYLAHYWETISFSLNIDNVTPEIQQREFERTVLRPLERGHQRFQDSLKGNLGLLVDEYVHVYLIRPATGADEMTDYRQYWDQIKDLVLGWIPQASDRWTEHRYDVVLGDNAAVQRTLFTTSRGRLLFKYDPRHRRVNGRDMRRTMLWSETTEIHNDEWEH